MDDLRGFSLLCSQRSEFKPLYCLRSRRRERARNVRAASGWPAKPRGNSSLPQRRRASSRLAAMGCLRVSEELKAGLREIAKRNIPVLGVSVDSWGVDYVLVNSVHPMISPPFHYRDDRTASTYERCANHGAELIFEETGIQFIPINTIYHLASDVERSPAILEAADCFLTIGDYFNYLFRGWPASMKAWPARLSSSIPARARGRSRSSSGADFRGRSSRKWCGRAPCSDPCCRMCAPRLGCRACSGHDAGLARTTPVRLSPRFPHKAATGRIFLPERGR